MNEYRFHVKASVTVYAESEQEARDAFVRSCQDQDEDVAYGEATDYIPSYGELTLHEVNDENGNQIFCL